MKKPARPRRDSPLYRRNLLLLILSSAALLIAAACLLYANFEQISQRIVFSNAMDSLNQSRQDATVLVETGQNLALQVYSDQSVIPLLQYSKLSERDKAVGLKQLGNYQFMKFIDSIYVYNDRTKSFYLSNAIDRYHNFIVPAQDFFDTDVLRWVDSFEEYPAYTPIPRKIVLNNGEERSFYSFFGYNYLDRFPDGSLACAVVVNISSDWIGGVMDSPQDTEASGIETFLLSQQGQVISDSPRYPMFQDLSGEAYVKELLATDTDGYLVAGQEQEKQFIAYTAPDERGWRYIRAIPYSLIVQDINVMRDKTIQLVLLLALAAFLLFYIINRVLYRPIETYRKDMEALSREHRQTFFGAKQNFLRYLLLESNGGLSKNTLSRQFEAYDIHFPTDGIFITALVKLDAYQEFLGRSSAEERAAACFGIGNIAGELFAPELLCESTDMGLGELALLLRGEEQGLPDKEEFSLKMRQFQKTVHKYLALSVSVFVSEPGPVEQVSRLYGQVLEIKRLRMFSGSECLLFYADRTGLLSDTQWAYPEKKERLLVEALAKGSYEQAQVIYLEIIDGCKESAYAQFGLVISRLTLCLNQLMAVLLKRWPDAELPSEPLSVDPDAAETIDVIHHRFFAFMRQIAAYSGRDKKKGKGELLADSVDKIISIQFADPNLCVESIADTLGLTASYLGRLYKQNTGCSITERMQSARMEAAKKLLAETDDPVTYIAQEVGYSSDTYFYKLFKQDTGVTPVDYRKNQLTGARKSSAGS